MFQLTFHYNVQMLKSN